MRLSFECIATKVERVEVTPDSAKALALRVIFEATGVYEDWYEREGNLCRSYRERGDIETEIIRSITSEDICALDVIKRVKAISLAGKSR